MNWEDVDASSVFVAKLSKKRRNSHASGFCVGIGAPKCVIGQKELRIVSANLGRCVKKKNSSLDRFRSVDTTF